MLAALAFALGIVMPNLLLMALGFFMQKKAFIQTGFIETASSMVFNYCLPCLLFFGVIKSEVNYIEQLDLLMAGILATFILFFLAEIYAKFFVKAVADKGVFVQGVFRSNMAIMSLAVVANAYGEIGLGIGAVYMGVITVLYNILAVITLSKTHQVSGGFFLKSLAIGKKVVQNPLVIALLLAFLCKGLHLPTLPNFLIKTGELLGAIALPLALICAGATLNIKTMLNLSGISMQASLGRILLAPMVAVAVGLMFDLTPIHMGVLFLMMASPVAAASYVMAKAMGGNEVLAANILGFTTIFSTLGMAIGMAILRMLALV